MTTPFLRMVDHEVRRAQAKHAPINSPHEGYAVILEELDELWDLVKQQRPDPAEMLTELIQIAAMAARTAEDCELIAPNHDTPELVMGLMRDAQT